MMMKKRGGVISQEVNPRPPIIKVRLNKSFLSRRELASPRHRRHSLLSKDKDEEGDVSFNSCNASSEEGYSESRSSEECLVHPIDAAIVKGPNLIGMGKTTNTKVTKNSKSSYSSTKSEASFVLSNWAPGAERACGGHRPQHSDGPPQLPLRARRRPQLRAHPGQVALRPRALPPGADPARRPAHLTRAPDSRVHVFVGKNGTHQIRGLFSHRTILAVLLIVIA